MRSVTSQRFNDISTDVPAQDGEGDGGGDGCGAGAVRGGHAAADQHQGLRLPAHHRVRRLRRDLQQLLPGNCLLPRVCNCTV